MNPVPVTRTDVRFLPDPRRVVTRLFVPGDEIFPDGRSTIEAAYQGFWDRHADLRGTLEGNFGAVADRVTLPADISEMRRQLIGAYFTHEYSFESAALGNPSLVPASDQSGLGPGDQRFILSLFAVGEGHLSSIEFVLDPLPAQLHVRTARCRRRGSRSRGCRSIDVLSDDQHDPDPCRIELRADIRRGIGGGGAGSMASRSSHNCSRPGTSARSG